MLALNQLSKIREISDFHNFNILRKALAFVRFTDRKPGHLDILKNIQYFSSLEGSGLTDALK
jgi:hypothetical protein